ncbi:hypothetical protein [Desulfuromonas sp. CSMB_57]|uniref:hypothetical protein n=1 Tax=Desulfuromonas sp. CSMB_57 TaxID=2807629 RepID=UPI001CD37ECC|nr:hypothetical protein [Desulfuromonas sp. CSMB_57]
MKNYLFKALVFVLVASGFYYAGIRVGNYQTTKRIDRQIEKSLYALDATEIRNQVMLLELLKAGDYNMAQNRLEAFLDVGLAGLALYVNNPPLNPDSEDKEIIEAISIAKNYREKYPGHQVNSTFENSVKKTLDYVSNK